MHILVSLYKANKNLAYIFFKSALKNGPLKVKILLKKDVLFMVFVKENIACR